MPFIATLLGARPGFDPATVEIRVQYRDSADQDWTPKPKTLIFTFDPAQTGAQQRAALQTLIMADAQRYKSQLATYAGLMSLIGQSIVIGPP